MARQSWLNMAEIEINVMVLQCLRPAPHRAYQLKVSRVLF